MPISRYERVVIPWDEIKPDLMKTPYVHKVVWSKDTDVATVEISRLPVHQYWPYTSPDNDEVVKLLNGERSKAGAKTIPRSYIQRMGSFCGGGRRLVDFSWGIYLREYCEINCLPFEIERDETEIPLLVPRGKRLRCHLGFHKFEKGEPEIKEFVRSTGLNVLFMTSAVQHGIKRCRDCGYQQHVERSGYCGLGGSANEWTKCTPERGREIDALPIL